MFTQPLKAAAVALSLCSVVIAGALPQHVEEAIKRGIPAEPTGVKTITSPGGATIRYKEPGKEGICETTPGVNSYSGYVDLDSDTHVFFWFFEARHNASTAPLTLWLNGGPGSDSLIGLFQELGPCHISPELKSHLNPYSFSEASNLLFLSQPVGTGFSYSQEVVGVVDPDGLPQKSKHADGRYSKIDPYKVDTTELAAVGAWHVLQAFLATLGQLDSGVKSKDFNLWTESYGGHYGPVFYRYFYDQNKAIANGTAKGVELNMHTLGIGNGIINERVQAPSYPEFAYKNTYGIQTVNETIYNFMKLAYTFPGGCRDSIDFCYEIIQDKGQIGPDAGSHCAEATAVCSKFVEDPYFEVSGRSAYDIRANASADIPPSYFVQYLNLASTQNAIGVDLNYTDDTSTAVGYGFDYTGDIVYANMMTDLEAILDTGVRIALYYGDADYICNWFGGEALSLALNYTHSAQFAAAGYQPFVVNGVEYGESRQYGNFSFTRIYEAGHEVPYYQPVASLEYFKRVIGDLMVADGKQKVTDTSASTGDKHATHAQSLGAEYTGNPDSNPAK